MVQLPVPLCLVGDGPRASAKSANLSPRRGMKMRAAIYARVSSERKEKEHTVGSQLEALRNYAAQHGMNSDEESTDEEYSGARLDGQDVGGQGDVEDAR